MHNFLLVGLPNINILEPTDPEDCILLLGIHTENTNIPSHFCRHNQTLLLPLTKNSDWKRTQPLQKGDTPNSIIPGSMSFIWGSNDSKFMKNVFLPSSFNKLENRFWNRQLFVPFIYLVLYLIKKKPGKEVEIYLTVVKLHSNKPMVPKLSGKSIITPDFII